jgi:WhiB family redox-sensing transcriptional regulator
MRDGSWWSEARCRDLDAAIFFPPRGDNLGIEVAKRICKSCSVRVECLDCALSKREVHGVWGGTSERHRRRLRELARANVTRPA